jgi:copper chaperone
MKTLKFKTNINCSGCVASVTPHLNKEAGIKEWNVDTNNSDKILTVGTESLDAEDVKNVVEKAGFKAEDISQ